ncbi:MAG TPA: hypothetical protein VEW66_02950 [Thermomicrobiales bacterium]|nr:hypothetical protein [Thermomicrobiales bacterium]
MSHLRRFILVVTAFLLAVTPTLAQFDQEIRQEVEDDIQDIRSLPLLEEFGVSTMSAEEYLADTVDSLDTDYPPADRALDQRVLIAFGLLDPEVDLGDAYTALMGSSVAGYYDPFADEMVIVTTGDDDELGAFDQVTYAHETVHAIQDQHFDLGAMLTSEEDMTTDESLAMRSLAEGDATVAELDYLLSDMELARAYLDELESMDLDEDVLNDAPAFLSGTLMFPYTDGYEFVQFLHDEGGWDLVNEAYGNLPVSSEQIMHPELYLEGEDPIDVQVPDLSSSFGDDWSEIDQDSMGEFVISLMFGEGELSDEQAELSAAGWGGDAYSVIANEDELAILWNTAWDSEEDAEEFARAMAVREGHRFDGEVTTNGDETLIEGDGVVVRIVQQGTDVTYQQATDLDTLALQTTGVTETAPAPDATSAALKVD